MLRALFIITCVSGLAFLSLYVFRTELYAKTEIEQAALGGLYPISQDTLAIEGLSPGDKPAHLNVTLRNPGACSKWQLRDGKRALEMTASTLSVPVREGKHDYALEPFDCTISSPDIDAIALSVYFGKASSGGFSIQQVSVDQYQITQSNVPILMGTPPAMNRWVPDVAAFSDAEADQALDMLQGAGFDFDAPTLDKIRFLVALVRKNMVSGAPPPELNSMTPWSVISQKHDGRTGNFCRQFSLGYGYLANLVGIPTRNLITGSAQGLVDMGSHAFSESYIAEQARWAYVDPTNNMAYVQNPVGRVLNAAELYLASTSDTTEGLRAAHLDEGRYSAKPFGTVSAGVREFFHEDNYLIYIGSKDGLYQMQGQGIEQYAWKLYRFLFQPKQYFGHRPIDSAPWLRPLTFFISVLSGMLFVVLGLRAVLRRLA
ncbi:hypothetical protein V5T82_14400 [Magnetovibrio sp. PR-2]|uniref:hypothetical protein n=1 Tax=Magnetovibrio sp. PR-2 TaxID=3120356 RepID=UPI002FCDEB6C